MDINSNYIKKCIVDNNINPRTVEKALHLPPYTIRTNKDREIPYKHWANIYNHIIASHPDIHIKSLQKINKSRFGFITFLFKKWFK